MNGEYLPEEKFIRKAYFKLANKSVLTVFCVSKFLDMGKSYFF